jgi:GTP-binding protein
MQEQTEAALASADAVLFLVDARAGSTPVDRAFADLVRRSGKPAIVVANKSEGRAAEAGRLEAYELGLGEPVAVSAEHGEGLADLYQALRAALPGDRARRGHRTTRWSTRRRNRRGPGAEPDSPLRWSAVPIRNRH